MKRIFLTIVTIVGVGGLVSLMRFHPNSAGVGAAAVPTGASNTTTSSTPAGGTAAVGGPYKDGTFTGSTVDVGYGPVQVQAVVSGGKLTQVNFLQMPSASGHSQNIAAQAGPILMQEAISAQSAQVNTVSGATADSGGFVQSLQTALTLAKA